MSDRNPIRRALEAMRRKQGPNYGDALVRAKRAHAQAFIAGGSREAIVAAALHRQAVETMGEEFYAWLHSDDAPTPEGLLPSCLAAGYVDLAAADEEEGTSDDVVIEITYDPETDEVFVWEPHGGPAEHLTDDDVARVLRIAADTYYCDPEDDDL